MLENFTTSYWRTLVQLNELNPTPELQAILNSTETLSEDQVGYLKRIPQVQNLFRFEEAFQSNDDAITNFIQQFPYQRASATSDSEMMLRDIFSQFTARLDLTQPNNFPATNRIEQPSATTTANLARSNLDNVTTTTRAEQDSLDLDFEEEQTNQLTDTRITVGIPRQDDFELLIQEKPLIPEETPNQPDQNLPENFSLRDGGPSLQDIKQQKKQADLKRQEKLHSKGILNNYSTRNSNDNSKLIPINNSNRTPLRKVVSNRFKKAVYGSIFGTAGATGGLVGYLTLFNI